MEEKALKLFEKAKKQKDQSYTSTLEQAYLYCCPRRYPKSDDKDPEIYESSPIYAVKNRVASYHEALFPPFREWIEPLPEDQVPENNKSEFRKRVAEVKEKVHLAIEDSNFHTEIEDTLTDAMFSDGAILCLKGTPEHPLIFEAVDWDSFYSLNAYDGLPRHNFLVRSMELDKAKYLWPKADFSEIRLTNGPVKEMQVMDCYTYDDFKGVYSYQVFVGDKKIFSLEGLTSSPWVIFNQEKRMRRQVGYGPVLDSLPDIRTSNKVVEMLLKNASINLSGIWQAEDDGVINIDNITMTPGEVIPKAIGSKGLEPLHTNIELNLHQFVLADLKENIKKQIMGSAMPEYSQGIRTASELQMRDAEVKRAEIPTTLRLAQGSKLLFKRIYEILSADDMKASPYYCPPIILDSKKIRLTSSSPLVWLKEQIDYQNSLAAISSAAQIFGPDATYEVLKTADYVRDFLIRNKVEPKKIRDDEEIEEYRDAKQQNQLALAQAGIKKTTA